MTLTRTPCAHCGNPSDAARWLAGWLNSNRNPSANQLWAAATLREERAQERVDAFLVASTTADAEWRAAERTAADAAERAKVEQQDAAKSGLPVALQEQVEASAKRATATAVAAQASADALAERVKVLAPDLAAAIAAAKQAAEDTFTAADIAGAYEEIGVEESEGSLYPTNEPTPEQADTRRRLGVTF